MATLTSTTALPNSRSKSPRSRQPHAAKSPRKKGGAHQKRGDGIERRSNFFGHFDSPSISRSSGPEKKQQQHYDATGDGPPHAEPVITSSVQRQKGKLVKRSTPQFRPQTPVVAKHEKAAEKAAGVDGPSYYRCDIHAINSADFAAVIAECKQLVVEAGGKALDGYEYVGGFLYCLPPTATTNPLDDSDASAAGGHISISLWTTPFNAPVLDGLRLNPPGRVFPFNSGHERKGKERERPQPGGAWPRNWGGRCGVPGPDGGDI